MSDNTSSFHPGIVLDGARILAMRLDDDLVVQEVAGTWCEVMVGEDVRDAVPALIGMEEELAQDLPYVNLPFVTLGTDHQTPAAISVQRDHQSGAIWVLLRDVSEEAAVQERLVQQHNALSLAHRELAAARDAALAADRAKTTFLANVSHELRTPLNVVIGGASILLKERATPLPSDDVDAFAQDIHDSGVLLLQLVDDLIDLSRAETGNLTLYEEWCQPVAIIDEMIRLVRGLPDARDMEITYTCGEAQPELYADPRRIKQILLNLLSNAIKACAPSAKIEVETALSQGGDLLLRVRDDGPGMSRSELAVALEPFGQPNADQRAKGAGLGLAIVSRLTRMHDGTFEVDTAPGSGLTATITMPRRRLPVSKAV